MSFRRESRFNDDGEECIPPAVDEFPSGFMTAEEVRKAVPAGPNQCRFVSHSFFLFFPAFQGRRPGALPRRLLPDPGPRGCVRRLLRPGAGGNMREAGSVARRRRGNVHGGG